MITSYELLDDCVRVEVDAVIGGVSIGVTSYVVSYDEFKKALQQELKDSESEGGKELQKLSMWKTHNDLNIPKNTIEVKVHEDKTVTIRQMIGRNNFPILKVRGDEVDASRMIVDIQVTAQNEILDVAVYTFKGLLYGFHKEEHLVENEFLTLKLQEELRGLTYERIYKLDTEQRIWNIKEEDIGRSTNNSFLDEVRRVRGEGGAIRWEAVTC